MRSVKSIKRSCDRLWSQVVRAGGECERCGATEAERQLHPHHIYGRSNHRLRFEPRNGVCLCATCHRWAHGNPLDFADWFRDRRPQDAAYLHGENAQGLLKRTLDDYLELERDLQDRLRKEP